MSDIQPLIAQIRTFRDARDWEQFHNPKDHTLALKLQELFLWKGNEDANPDKLKNELADKHGLDVKQILEDKMKLNNEK